MTEVHMFLQYRGDIENKFKEDLQNSWLVSVYNIEKRLKLWNNNRIVLTARK